MTGNTQCNPQNINTLEPSSQKKTDAVGVADAQWFIALVRVRSELTTARRLAEMGYETYVPVQKNVKTPRTNHPTKAGEAERHGCEHPLISGKLFVRCTEAQRHEILSHHLFDRFMVNIAGQPNKFNRRPVATIPDGQMQAFRRMVEKATKEVIINPADLHVGDEVTVTRGSLKGIHGRVATAPDGHNRLVINLDFIGVASTTLPASYLSTASRGE